MKILITGGTNGMGKGVARVLAGKGNPLNEIIILCRNKMLGENTVREITKATANINISYVLCDLSRLADVRKVIAEIKNRHHYLDAIFINAGLGYAAKHVITEDGLDAHFQVNYLSQFMLTLNLLELLEKSNKGSRVIFNVIEHGKILWDDLHLKKSWRYKTALLQAMAAKRLFLYKLHNLHNPTDRPDISFIGFEIPKTVWTNQIHIIPGGMRMMASLARLFGQFISLEQCGEIMAPLFMESADENLKRSGTFITLKRGHFTRLNDDSDVINAEAMDRLWDISLQLCNDKQTKQIADKLETEASSCSNIVEAMKTPQL